MCYSKRSFIWFPIEKMCDWYNLSYFLYILLGDILRSRKNLSSRGVSICTSFVELVIGNTRSLPVSLADGYTCWLYFRYLGLSVGNITLSRGAFRTRWTICSVILRQYRTHSVQAMQTCLQATRMSPCASADLMSCDAYSVVQIF